MTVKTPLYKRHQEWGARLVDFAGFTLPVQYEGIIQEHRAVREKAGLFDVSHMGEILISGSQSLELVQFITTNDAGRLKVNQVQYTFLCAPDGGVIDDILVYRLKQESFLLVINAANIAKDLEWIKEQQKRFPGAEVENRSELFAQLALQGPLAVQILAALTAYNVKAMRYYWCEANVDTAGVKTLLSRTGYTGEDGFELYAAPQDVVKLFDSLMEEGGKVGLKPAGLGARDTLRLEAGMPLYGHELSPRVSPLEAGLERFVDLGKGEFVGKEAMTKKQEKGFSKTLVGFETLTRGIPRQGYPLVWQGKKVGEVTSGAFSPTLQKSLGMGYLPPELAYPGEEIGVEIRGKIIGAQLVPLPFYKRGDKK